MSDEKAMKQGPEETLEYWRELAHLRAIRADWAEVDLAKKILAIQAERQRAEDIHVDLRRTMYRMEDVVKFLAAIEAKLLAKRKGRYASQREKEVALEIRAKLARMREGLL